MKYLYPLALFMLLFLSACSAESNTAAPEKETTSNAEQKKIETEESTEDSLAWWKEEPEYYEVEDDLRELTKIEQMLMRKPGPFSAENFDAEQAKEKLDELPKNAPKEELQNAILSLIHEDYHEETEIFLKFDPSVNVNVATPDETIDEPTIANTHFAILLDASGSMAAQSQGGTRMDDAKSAIQNFIKDLPENSTVSLRVYGHEGSNADKDQQLSCGSTEVIYTGGTDMDAISSALDKINPTGWTPIGKALSETKNDIPKEASTMIVYVVSDGIETCDGNPVEEAEKLANEGIQPIINIIGFQVDNEAQKLLKEVAQAGNGEFSFVNSKQELEAYWDKEYDRMMKAWTEWRDEGMEQADEISDKLMDLADETGVSIMDKSDIEFEHAEDLVNYLRENDYENTDKLWNYFYDRSKDIWSYGYDTKVKNWQDAYHNGIDAWQHFYDEGNAKWTEYYKK
ncbi:VWA domain-containing protein [Mesobacillus maritimus]|uniref:vWA domain-containing protein n=1 Tax=Mesobacillus maritimus TaxID=1643336 RepID=UPI0020412DAB|nr:VWA domain-containing protein [Mesobacillus maritimus]MCM3584602.1 VWA domain-containing protein [Mesobacillus maritimus]